VRKEVGQGRSVYLPFLQFDGSLPEMENHFSIGNRFWKRPKNWQDLASAIGWAAKDNILVRISGPEYLVANLVSQPEMRRMMLHLVNYDARKAALRRAVEVTCRVPGPTKEVLLISPDTERTQVLELKNEPLAVTFSVPPVKVYSIAVISG
jgi:hypothetical protein